MTSCTNNNEDWAKTASCDTKDEWEKYKGYTIDFEEEECCTPYLSNSVCDWPKYDGYVLEDPKEEFCCEIPCPIPMPTMCVHVKVPPPDQPPNPYRPASCIKCHKDPFIHMIKPPAKIGPVQLVGGVIRPKCDPRAMDIGGKVTFLNQ